MSNSTSSNLQRDYAEVPAASPVQSTPPPPQVNELARSPIMLASTPGMGRGPDAVLRQFYGGRAVPKSRIFTPRT
jgi:hypothetical protein